MSDEVWELKPSDASDCPDWMEAHGRTCPSCGSTALRPKQVRRRLAATASSTRGIDTSDEEDVFDLVCDDCGFDNSSLNVEEVRSWAESRRES